MSSRVETSLWLLQRVTAVVLVLTVAIHLITIVYAIHGQLTAGVILTRLRGNIAWFVVYGTFVTAAALHVPIGLRTILKEWSPLHPTIVDSVAILFGVLLAGLGWRAVLGLFA